MKCAKCDKEMTSPQGVSVMGVEIRIGFSSDSEELQEFAKKQLGKYELHKQYSFCYECLLDSLFRREI